MGGTNMGIGGIPMPESNIQPEIPQDAVYSYVRDNGAVEWARSPEEVYAKCSKMAQLALKSPDQANILLELTAVGRDKMQAAKQSEDSETNDRTKFEQESQQTFTSKLRTRKTPEANVSVIKDSQLKPEPLRIEEAVIRDSVEEPGKLEYDNVAYDVDSRHDEFVGRNEEVITEIQESLININTDKAENDLTLNMLSVKGEPTLNKIPPESEIDAIQSKPQLGVEVSTAMPDLYPLMPATEAVAGENNTQAQIEPEVWSETEISKLNPTEILEDVPGAIYASDYVSTQETDEPITTSEPENIEEDISNEVVTLHEYLLEMIPSTSETTHAAERLTTQKTITDYDAHIEAIASGQTIVELDEIKDAQQEPVNAIEKLAVYLRQSIDNEVPSAPEAAEIIELLVEVSEELAEFDDSAETGSVLTIEVVQKLTELFDKLGYEKPRQAVKEYFQDNGAAEGLEILRYLANLARAYDAQEASLFSTLALGNDNEPIFAKVGKLAVHLLFLGKIKQAT